MFLIWKLTMILVCSFLGVGIPSSLLGHDMDENRACRLGALHVLENGDQVIYVVPIDRTDVVETELFEQGRP